MNINQLKNLIPAQFEYPYINAEGEMVTEIIHLKISRLAFRDSVEKEFRDAFANIEEDAGPLGELLADAIKWWDIYLDDDEQEMFPITADNILERPTDFVMRLVDTVSAKLFPNPPKAERSDDGSAQEEKSIAASISNGGTDSPLQAVFGE